MPLNGVQEGTGELIASPSVIGKNEQFQTPPCNQALFPATGSSAQPAVQSNWGRSFLKQQIRSQHPCPKPFPGFPSHSQSTQDSFLWLPKPEIGGSPLWLIQTTERFRFNCLGWAWGFSKFLQLFYHVVRHHKAPASADF